MAGSDSSLAQLNSLLETRSFITGGNAPTQEDFDRFDKIKSNIDIDAFPHAQRWFRHIGKLKVVYPLKKWSAGTAGGAGDTKKEGGKGKDQARLEGLLPGAEMGKVCTRFPPEPSGYLHIGHAKAAMLNHHYAKHYNGRMLLRFDDTNPTKEKQEFQDAIIKDLATLKIHADKVSHTSDHFDALQKAMEGMLKDGFAYVDDTDVDTMRQERDAGIASKRREQSVDENVRLWKEMLKGSADGVKCCVRAKMDMSNKNKCLRDPVFYRCKTDVAHHRTGFTYKAYPTYDFACPIVDSIEGVTHAMRTIEYKDREPMYHWVLEHVPGLRKVELIEFAKTQFSHTILSKRKLTWFVENGFVDGWDDPRFPTVQGVMRRGMTVEALADFVMTQGMSKATNLMEWDKIWAINRGKIDPIVPRFPAVGSDAAVVLTLDGPADVTCKMEKKHAKNEELGERVLLLSKAVYLEQDDAQAMEQGEQITLMHWGNAFVDKIVKDPKTGMVTSLVGRLNLEGNVKDTKKKVHWVPKLEDQITPVILRELDHLVTKPKIEDDDDIKDLINPVSSVDTAAIGDPLLKTLPKGSMLQLERRGYYIVDVPAFPLGKPMLLIKIPDGKAKDTSSIKSKVDPSKLQGSHGTKKGEKSAPAEKAPASESVADPAASQKPAAKAKASGKAKAKATGGGKPEDRPLDDISRLNLVVGKITKVWEHPEADKLWCEEIDLGEGAPRTIASGLRLHLKDSEMVNQLVIVLANLKHRKLVGFMSQGMVLCATGSDGRVELLQPPSGAKVGERVAIEGVEMGEPDAQLNEKTGKAPLVALKDGMRTTDGKQAAYNGAVWQTSAGPVACKSVADGTIS